MPAVQALLVQSVALVLVLAAAQLAAQLTAYPFTIAHAVMLQALLAAGLARAAGMARWWPWIHLLFPPAVAVAHALRLPPWLFLAAFVALVLLYWSSFRTQVPYYPSRRATWDAVAGLLPQDRPVSFIDIGSGFGGLSLHLARQRRDGRFAGIELAPLPWLVSRLRAAASGSGADFRLGDYEALHLGDYDVVFAYLSPAAMPRLWEKARGEMRAGALLLSCEFPIPGKAADLVLRPLPDGPLLHGWRL
jgi:SAM-dependent methyltransferase